MFTLYSSDYIGNPGNCYYPHRHTVTDLDSLRAAVGHDYVDRCPGGFSRCYIRRSLQSFPYAGEKRKSGKTEVPCAFSD